MTPLQLTPVTAFRNDKRLATGPLHEVALAVKALQELDTTASILVFDDATGKVIDLDLRGTDADVLTRLEQSEAETEVPQERGQPAGATSPGRRAPRGRGRPALGVISREVTLLPRHWTWLAAQPRSASASLRRLLDEARHAGRGQTPQMKAHEAAYRFMSAMAGNLPGFEEAIRALFAGDLDGFERQMANWPADLRNYALKLAASSAPPSGSEEKGMREPEASSAYVQPSPEAARALLQRGISGPVIMLNLLRLRETADYSGNPELAPDSPISGAEAFARYVAHTLPFLRASGGELLFLGKGGDYLIGPADRRWDRVMLVRQSSVESFMAFADDTGYLAGLGHRSAAVEDSRLLPISELHEMV